MNEATTRTYEIASGRILRAAAQIRDLSERVSFYEALAERIAIFAESNARYLETLEDDA